MQIISSNLEWSSTFFVVVFVLWLDFDPTLLQKCVPCKNFLLISFLPFSSVFTRRNDNAHAPSPSVL